VRLGKAAAPTVWWCVSITSEEPALSFHATFLSSDDTPSSIVGRCVRPPLPPQNEPRYQAVRRTLQRWRDGQGQEGGLLETAGPSRCVKVVATNGRRGGIQISALRETGRQSGHTHRTHRLRAMLRGFLTAGGRTAGRRRRRSRQIPGRDSARRCASRTAWTRATQ
jgi:hypothetical protein